MNDEDIKVYWHSTAHIMAQAVKELFPDVKLGMGPPIEDGFYYDFDIKKHFTPSDITKIERKMSEIIKRDTIFVREEINKDEAGKIFKDEKYKLEILEELNGSISIYRQGDFVDLCTGPHILSTGKIKAFKLLSVAGAYWKGDETKPMLQRIYGVSYEDKKDIENHLKRIEEAKQRDHRKLGKDLDLFSISDELGPGLVCWHPKGMVVKEMIEEFWKEEHRKRGYMLVSTPHIARAELFQKSGHYDYYRENISTLKMGNQEYVLKPMNCPLHILIYKRERHSYRELPIRYAELGTVYRYEKVGVLHGLLRVRGFTQDDAHIFATETQVENEIVGCIDLAQYMLKAFGFLNYQVELSVRDRDKKEKYAGSDKDWDMAESALTKALNIKNIPYKKMQGEAVFYGPKIDIKVLDIFDRPSWQATTIQFDFNLPKRFDITYTGEDNKEHHVVMIHRAILGSMERFIGCLIEHYKGAFPFWLAPVQIIVTPISKRFNKYAEDIADKMRLSSESHKFRIIVDKRDAKIGLKIREASIDKIPYILIVGEKETKNNTVSVRERGKGDIGSFKVAKFMNMVRGLMVHSKITNNQ